ncbi:DHA2 family efflux MFS transporter permease subunit [Armatimonas rosea]|uniref:EmrB/QacA subfamily drug resistance transporter n=1 Tax=Armatimonas rosea TaxID=685828 RepID=A0A7W9SSW2_ARMRO|nr:DHA2 family efflux MFS transporter permease subunit [Armatimonas rosea]MBB6051433.1 EmrB/QacA subfamily drug resistance transporter [Armatimonas rosea]
MSSTESIKRFLPWLVAVAFFMESLDTTILNTAVPVMARELGTAPLSMKAVLSSYTLSLAVFIPISGWVADRFGTRRVFASAIGLFTLGSLLCGLAPTVHLLILCRILQGCGGAMMLPVGRLTMVRTFDKSELTQAMSFVAIPGLIGPMLGPLVGGLMVDYVHWRGIFFVNLPIGLLGLILVYRNLPNYRAASPPKFDTLGFVLFGVGISLLSYILEVFGEHTLRGSALLGLLALSLTCLVGYGIRTTHTLFPLLPLALFRVRTFRVSVSGSFFTRLGIGGIPFLFPLLYQVGLGLSPIQCGLLMMPQAVGSLGLKLLMPGILKRFGYRRILSVNTLVLGLLIGLFALVGAATPLWQIVLQALVFGFFTSLQYTSMNTLAYADVTPEQTSGASSIASTMQQLSVSFGIALASLLTAVFVPDRFSTSGPELIAGIHKAFLLLGGLTLASALVFRELRSEDGDLVSQHHALAHSE